MMQIDCPVFEKFVAENPDVNVNELLIAIVSFQKELSKGSNDKNVFDMFVQHSQHVENTRLVEIQRYMDKNNIEILNAWKKLHETSTKDTVQDVINAILQGDNSVSKPLFENQQAVDIIKSRLKDTDEKMDKVMKEIISSMEDVNTFVLPYKSKNNKVAGTLKEEHYERLLNEYLEEGYEVENISAKGGGHKCDLLVTYAGRDGNTDERCPILIEVKFWRSQAVNTDNVNKFHNDIVTNNTHGIMVSLEGKITYKHNMRYERIRDTNLYAFYLSNVGDDIDRVRLAMEVIYTLDDIMKANDGLMRLTPKVISTMIKSMDDDIKNLDEIEKYNEKAKKNIDDGLKKLKKLRLKKVRDTLRASLDDSEVDTLSDIMEDDEDEDNGKEKNVGQVVCTYCEKTLKASGANLSNHKAKCAKIPPELKKDHGNHSMFSPYVRPVVKKQRLEMK
jgi:hypothetical protein